MLSPARNAPNMIWTILGISVAILAMFCITVAETLVGKPMFENYRAHAAIALGVAGAICWFIGRAIAARDSQNEDAPRRFVLTDLRYWGPMLLALGITTVFIRPLRFDGQEKPTVVAKPAPKKLAEPPPKTPEPTIAVVKTPLAFPPLKMQGVIYRETKPWVILNGQSYTVGDRLGPVLVRAIDRSSVMLELDGEMKVLTIN
jgi:hypothetical protein